MAQDSNTTPDGAAQSGRVASPGSALAGLAGFQSAEYDGVVLRRGSFRVVVGASGRFYRLQRRMDAFTFCDLVWRKSPSELATLLPDGCSLLPSEVAALPPSAASAAPHIVKRARERQAAFRASDWARADYPGVLAYAPAKLKPLPPWLPHGEPVAAESVLRVVVSADAARVALQVLLPGGFWEPVIVGDDLPVLRRLVDRRSVPVLCGDAFDYYPFVAASWAASLAGGEVRSLLDGLPVHLRDGPVPSVPDRPQRLLRPRRGVRSRGVSRGRSPSPSKG